MKTLTAAQCPVHSAETLRELHETGRAVVERQWTTMAVSIGGVEIEVYPGTVFVVPREKLAMLQEVDDGCLVRIIPE